MSDLISRAAAIDAIVGMTTMGIEELANAGNKERFDWIKGLSDSLVKIINLPSAEPEIIYCKDCRHNGSFDTDCPITWNKTENDYCSFAERMTDD